MHPAPRPKRPLAFLPVLLALALAPPLAPPALAADASAGRPVWARSGVHLSAAYERMLRDEIEMGRVLPPGLAERWGLDVPMDDESFTEAPGDLLRAPRRGLERVATVGLATDAQLNDKTGDATCASCGSRPLGQAETTIAAHGSFLLAGWNDTKGFCTGGPVQGYGWSTDGGATWVDGGDPPSPLPGGRFRGDPVHAVNRKTGSFYVCGLYEQPGDPANSGIALIRGHFAGGTFVIDANSRPRAGGSDFLDKEWLAADSLSGNLYVSYSNFVGGWSSQIEFIRSTDNGVSWSAPQVLSAPASYGNVQGSRPVVGPDGEVYVVWYDYGYPVSHNRVRRSDDFGASFGSEQTICAFYENGYSGAPGFRRGFAPTLPGAAVDVSDGPHRGRLYVTWDEAVDFYDAPFPGSPITVTESENNGFFASATPFTVGDRLRGGCASSSDVDLYRFSGLRGQTLFFAADSARDSTTFNLRLVCAADTSTLNNYRLLTFSQSRYPACAFTLPADGTWYLRMNIASSGPYPATYRILTTWDTPTPGERARDHRDRFVAYSDDGTTWSTPVLLNDDDPWFDGIFPEVTVDGTGAAHAFWHDFRDDAGCGALSYEYVTSSGDGGDTWGANRRVSDVQSFWSINACGSANQGDYQGITSQDDSVYPCWADSRLGDPDPYAEADRFAHTAVCPAPVAVGGGSNVFAVFSLTNAGNVPGTFAWTVSDDNGWLDGATPSTSGTVTLAASAVQNVTATLRPSGDCWPAAVDTVRFTASDAFIPGRTYSCQTTVTCAPTTTVTPVATRLALAPPQPNPSSGKVRLGFTLSRPGPVRLALYSASGARVRLLADSEFGAGVHEAGWDGRDDGGHRVAAGLYYARLEAEGRTLARPVGLIR